DRCMQLYFAVLARDETQLVGMVEKLKQGLQFVVAVGTTPGDVQKQIELGRCRQLQGIARRGMRHGQCPSWRACQSLITRMICSSPRCALRRCGRLKPCWSR